MGMAAAVWVLSAGGDTDCSAGDSKGTIKSSRFIGSGSSSGAVEWSDWRSCEIPLGPALLG